jgi:adenosylmethionine-8-amino-7-oxononanoate aminotransferase
MSASKSSLLLSLLSERPTAVRGEGVWLYDADGRAYLDGCSGAVAANIGHGVAEVADALSAQAHTLAFPHRSQFHNEPAERLAGELATWTGGQLPYAMFTSSGSEAVEAAVQLALRYHAARGEPGRTVVLSRRMSYHGATLGARSAGGNPVRRAPFESLLHDWPQVEAPYCYRCPLGLNPASCRSACLDSLEQAITAYGRGRVAAFVAEPVTGASAGALRPPAGYYERVREICDRHGVLFVADEVMTGAGRTGRPFGYQHWDARPDIVTFGKGIAGGYVALAGILCTGEVAEAVATLPGGPGIGHTFTDTPVAAAAGVAVVEYLRDHDLIARADALGPKLRRALCELAETHGGGVVGDVRGEGLMWGLELVADRHLRTPYPPEAKVTARLLATAKRHGLLLYPAGGGIDGTNGDAVLVAPPLTITDDDLAELLRRLGAALDDLFRQLNADQATNRLYETKGEK